MNIRNTLTLLFLFLIILVTSCKLSTDTTKSPSQGQGAPATPLIPAVDFWKGVKQFGAIDSEPSVTSIAHSSTGDIIMAGIIFGKNGLDGLPQTSNADVFIIRYDSAGTRSWMKKYTTVANDMCNIGSHSVLIDKLDNIYLLFSCGGQVIGGPAPIGAMDSYIVKLDKSGNQLWIKNYSPGPALGAAWVISASFDSQQNIVFGGWATDGTFEGGGTACDLQEAFLIKADRDGKKLWAHQYKSTSGVLSMYAITLDANDNIFTVGDTNKSPADYEMNAWAAKYNSLGVKLWTNIQPAPAGAYLSYADAVTDKQGNLILIGTGEGGNNGTNYSTFKLTGGTDSFTARINANGTSSWVQPYGNNNSTYLNFTSIVTNGTDFYVAGSTNGPFNGLSLWGFEDSFLMKIQPDFGWKSWIRQISYPSGSVYQSALDISFDPATEAYSLFVVGTTSVALGGTPQSGPFDVYVQKYDAAGNPY